MHPTPIPMGRKRCGSRRSLRKYVPKIISRCPKHSPLSAPDSNHWRPRRLMRQNTQSTCRFHLLPSRRRLRPIHGLAFTPELAPALAQLGHKDFMRCGSLPYLLRLEPVRTRPREAEAFPKVLPLEELCRGAAGPVFLHVGTSFVDPTENW
jgi:hypothetical protein